ncbi:MAG: dTDP-4-dehydrorhamnose 3,5-epimerase [Bacteroidia bacterium]|jgi:dTDP-4-dehydrorhamnose 3,5-epimerase|nr:dTDP-4-dehydrorhamnose 3,5-epimerase [Bacteroidales bacterium]NCC45586.1 dTDP-4-dehydrorhamnose 3,5-epimerase [Bacteroidia bacterium]
MKVIQTSIPEVLIIDPKVFYDQRGYFMESFSERLFRDNVMDTRFVQDNESKSGYGVLRGLHYQLPPFAQSKLVRVVSGRVLDVAVDIRKGSPTFGRYVSAELTCDNKLMMFIPRGFAHGFAVLSEECLFQYKCDNYYSPEHEASIRWDDNDINIDWRIPSDDVLLSQKDMGHPGLYSAKLFDYNQNLYQ